MVHFTSQLLQEYFAAHHLKNIMAQTSAVELFPPEKWWEPQGWDETLILLAALYNDDCTPVIEWLKDAQPEVAARCIVESGAHYPAEKLADLRDRWLPRLTDLRNNPSPKARAAVGRALGRLQLNGEPLDNRKGVSVISVAGEALPDIDWVEIPTGKLNPNKKSRNEPLFFMARYPITFGQFQTFLDDPKGYTNPLWWEELTVGKENKLIPGEQTFQFNNHPREGVSWNEAIAFCRWLTEKTKTHPQILPERLEEGKDFIISLPTEWQWEEAARGTDAREYPYQGDFNAEKANTAETEIGQTSAVGIFPQGCSPYGVIDICGNIWEWCLNEYGNPENIGLRGADTRVVRGGSWNTNPEFARISNRNFYNTNNRFSEVGFRVVVTSLPDTHKEIMQFFKRAGFNVDAIFTDLLCTSSLPFWKDAPNLFVHILLNKKFDYRAIGSLVNRIENVFGTIEDQFVILVLDRQPTQEDLHQLFAIKNLGASIVPIAIKDIKQANIDSIESQILRGHLDLYLGQRDLYGEKTAIGDVLSFYGRNALLETLKQGISHGRSFIIYGLRKIGKSSLLLRLCEESIWPVALIDLQGYVGKIQDVYQEIINNWVLAVNDINPEIKLDTDLLSNIENAQDFRKGFGYILSKCRNLYPDIGLALFLDEVDILENERGYFELSSMLRKISEEPLIKGHFSILFAGLEPTLNRVDKLLHVRNPFFSFFEELGVGPFTIQDSENMTTSIGTQMGITYEKDALDLLIVSGGGHPFLTRQLCSYATRNVERPGMINYKKAQEAISKYLKFSQNYFAESLWMTDAGGPPQDEAVILKLLSESDGSHEEFLLSQEPLQDYRERHLAFDHLRDQNLIFQDNEGMWKISIPLYRSWIRKYILRIVE